MTEKEQLKQLLANVNALLGAMRFSASTATGDAANIGNFASYKTFLRGYNDLAKQALPLLPKGTTLEGFDIDKIKGIGGTIWPEQKVYFDEPYIQGIMHGLVVQFINLALLCLRGLGFLHRIPPNIVSPSRLAS